MTVPLTGVGGFFTRQGLFIGAANRIMAAYGSALDADTAAIAAQFVSTDANAVNNLYPNQQTARGLPNPAGTGTGQGVWSQYTQGLQQMGQNAAIAQVNDDVILPPNAGISTALGVLIAQMASGAQSLNRPTTSATATPNAANVGNGVVCLSLTDVTGNPLDMVFAETLTDLVTNDISGGATQFQEPATATGQPAYAQFDYRWPGGSGASVSLPFVDAIGSSGTNLVNGGFNLWGVGPNVNVPNTWVVNPGTTGTQVFQGTASPTRTGVSYMRFTSDGSTLTGIAQPVALKSLTSYCLNLWARISSLDGSGTVVFKLVDNSNTTIVNALGTPQTVTRNLNGQIGTGWTQIQVFFQTPRLLTNGCNLSIAFGVSPAAAKNVDFSLCALPQSVQLYAGGPFAQAFSFNVPAAKSDYYQFVVTNSLGVASLVRSMDRFYSLRQNSLAFPTSVSPTVPDGLIVL